MPRREPSLEDLKALHDELYGWLERHLPGRTVAYPWPADVETADWETDADRMGAETAAHEEAAEYRKGGFHLEVSSPRVRLFYHSSAGPREILTATLNPVSLPRFSPRVLRPFRIKVETDQVPPEFAPVMRQIAGKLHGTQPYTSGVLPDEKLRNLRTRSFGMNPKTDFDNRMREILNASVSYVRGEPTTTFHRDGACLVLVRNPNRELRQFVHPDEIPDIGRVERGYVMRVVLGRGRRHTAYVYEPEGLQMASVMENTLARVMPGHSLKVVQRLP